MAVRWRHCGYGLRRPTLTPFFSVSMGPQVLTGRDWRDHVLRCLYRQKIATVYSVSQSAAVNSCTKIDSQLCDFSVCFIFECFSLMIESALA